MTRYRPWNGWPGDEDAMVSPPDGLSTSCAALSKERTPENDDFLAVVNSLADERPPTSALASSHAAVHQVSELPTASAVR